MAYVEYNGLTAFTPKISGTTTAGTGTYTTQVGYWFSIGEIIFVSCVLVWTNHTGTGDMICTDLPFACRNAASYDPEIPINLIDIVIPANVLYVLGEIQPGDTTIKIDGITSSGANSPISLPNSGTLHFSGNYLK